jgi:hypothetical protein
LAGREAWSRAAGAPIATRVEVHIAALACARLTPAEKTAYLAKLRAHYKAKRNFVSTLPSLD